MLLDILKNFRKIPESDSDDPVLLEMQSDILLILSCICEVDMHKKVCVNRDVTHYDHCDNSFKARQKLACQPSQNASSKTYAKLEFEQYTSLTIIK